MCHHYKGDTWHIHTTDVAWVLYYYNMIFNDFSAVLEILVIFGGYWALFEARSWGEVGRLLPTSDLYKPEVLEAMEEVQNRFMLKIFQAKAIFMQGSH
jgi:hypothetical protein